MKVYNRKNNEYLGTLVIKYTLPVYGYSLYLVDVTDGSQDHTFRMQGTVKGWNIENCPRVTLPYKNLLKENRFYWNYSEENCKIKNDILEIE